MARWVTETGRFLDKPEDPQEGQWDKVVRETFLDARALHRIVGSTPNGLRELLEFAELYWSDVVRSYALTAYEGVEFELRVRFQGYRQNVQVFRRDLADTRVRVHSTCGLRSDISFLDKPAS